MPVTSRPSGPPVIDLFELIFRGERLLPGNFYRVLKSMSGEGLVDETAPTRAMRAQGAADAGANADRRRYFHLTPFGREVARAEARRLEQLVAESRQKRLLTQR